MHNIHGSMECLAYVWIEEMMEWNRMTPSFEVLFGELFE